MSKPVQIKKYDNRRLYDCEEKKYISLKEIEKIILNGRTVEIFEQKTGKDITRQVLIQVLTEMDLEKTGLFPVEFLNFLICSSPSVLKDYFETFFSRQISMFQKNRDLYLEALKSMENQWSFLKKGTENNPFGNFFNSLNPFVNEKEPEEENQKDEVSELKDQVRDLLKRLNDLEDRMS